MKKLFIMITVFLSLWCLTSCGTPSVMAPEIEQMKSICDMAVMDCYYHDVVKYHVDDAKEFLFWKQDKDLWMEYDAIVTLGIDVSLINLDIKSEKVIITIPQATIQSYTIDPDSMDFYTAKNSAKITVEDSLRALKDAEQQLFNEVSNNKNLLQSAQDRAKSLLEDYIINIGNLVDKQYTIQWKYCDVNGNRIK